MTEENTDLGYLYLFTDGKGGVLHHLSGLPPTETDRSEKICCAIYGKSPKTKRDILNKDVVYPFKGSSKELVERLEEEGLTLIESKIKD